MGGKETLARGAEGGAVLSNGKHCSGCDATGEHLRVGESYRDVRECQRCGAEFCDGCPEGTGEQCPRCGSERWRVSARIEQG